MKRLLVLGVFALLLSSMGCRSKASKLRSHQKRVDQVIAKCDRYMSDRKPAYAIRYYNRYIDYYRKTTGFEAGVARMLSRRAAAYAALGNLKRASNDMVEARKLDGAVQAPVAPAAPPVTPPAGGSGGGQNPGSGGPPAPKVGPDGIPAHQGDPIPIAVMNFDGAGDGVKYIKTFAPLLGDDLFNRGRFDVIERDQIDKLVGELKLSHTDLVAKAGSAEGLDILKIKYMVIGTITVEGNGVMVNARFVDWTTGQRVVTQTVKKMVQSGSVSFVLDEIAHDLGLKLEKAFVEKFPPEEVEEGEDMGWRNP